MSDADTHFAEQLQTGLVPQKPAEAAAKLSAVELVRGPKEILNVDRIARVQWHVLSIAGLSVLKKNGAGLQSRDVFDHLQALIERQSTKSGEQVEMAVVFMNRVCRQVDIEAPELGAGMDGKISRNEGITQGV